MAGARTESPRCFSQQPKVNLADQTSRPRPPPRTSSLVAGKFAVGYAEGFRLLRDGHVSRPPLRARSPSRVPRAASQSYAGGLRREYATTSAQRCVRGRQAASSAQHTCLLLFSGRSGRQRLCSARGPLRGCSSVFGGWGRNRSRTCKRRMQHTSADLASPCGAPQPAASRHFSKTSSVTWMRLKKFILSTLPARGVVPIQLERSQQQLLQGPLAPLQRFRTFQRPQSAQHGKQLKVS